ncbi:MAG: ABC transporter substrate-binding protein [Anaerolineae bacterium]|nr:ABC transporter substrate-binding protein [Anaerolineae bacterium]
MKRRLILFSIMLIGAMLMSMGAALAQDNTLIVAMNIDDIITLDPARSYETTNLMIQHATYDTLLDIHADDLNKIVPGVADSYTVSDDGLTYTFSLHKDVKFASGNPLTADDVVFSWTRLKNIKGNPAFYVDAVSSIEAVDPLTVKVTLSAKTPAFATIVTAPALSVLDSKLAKEHGATDAADADTTDTASDWLTQNSAGSGPFVLTSWAALSQVTMVRNDGYWRGPAKLAGVTLNHGTDSTTKLQSLEKGDVDVYEDVDKDLIEQVKADSNLKLAVGQTLNLTYLAISADAKFNLPLKDAKVRQAIAQAIDYDGIINGLLLGYSDRPAAMLPIGIIGSDPTKRYEHNVDAAKKLLADAGFPDGFELTLNASTGTSGGIANETLAAKIQADLAEVGIKVTIKQTPNTDFLTSYRAQELPFLFATWTPDYLDATMWSDYFSYPDAGPAKRILLNSTKIADLAKQGAAETDATKRAAIYAQYQQAHLDEAVFVPLLQPQRLYAMSTKVDGFVFHPVYFMDFYEISKS